MHLLCHKGQWIATKCLYYRSSLIKSTCTHRQCRFIHTVARVTSPKRLEVSSCSGDLSRHTVRMLRLLFSSFTCVGFKGQIQLKHLNLILIQAYLKGHGKRKRQIPEVWPHPSVLSQCLRHTEGGTGEDIAGGQWQTTRHLLERLLNWVDAQLDFRLRTYQKKRESEHNKILLNLNKALKRFL